MPKSSSSASNDRPTASAPLSTDTNASIREDGRVIRDMYLLHVKDPKESKYPWDYYKILDTVPGDKAFRPLKDGNCPLVSAAK
jgi:branched-chain amino acid transport system substrate-binding protein